MVTRTITAQAMQGALYRQSQVVRCAARHIRNSIFKTYRLQIANRQPVLPSALSAVFAQCDGLPQQCRRMLDKNNSIPVIGNGMSRITGTPSQDYGVKTREQEFLPFTKAFLFVKVWGESA